MPSVGTLSAQQAPDAGSLLREVERVEGEKAMSPQAPESLPGSESREDATPGQGPAITLSGFRFEGNTVVTDSEMRNALMPELGKPLRLAELNALGRKIRELYQERGYLARVTLPEQDLADGILRMVIQESRLGAVVVEGIENTRVRSSVVAGTVGHGQEEGALLRMDQLQRAASIAANIPGVKTRVILRGGQAVGSTDLVVPVEPLPFLSGTVTVDNHGANSSGEVRGLISLNMASPAGIGDQLGFVGLVSEGNRYAGFDYSVPVGYSGLRIGGNASVLDYDLVGNFEDLDGLGDAIVIGTSLTYPVIREAKTSLLFSARLQHRSYYNELRGIETSDKSATALTLGASFSKTDSMYMGGRTFFSGRLIAGDLDLSGNAFNELQDSLDGETAGSYQKFEFSVGRLQRVAEKTTLLMSLNGQLATKNLDSSETISLGGPNGVRAYPVLETTGDDGFSGTLELVQEVSNGLEVHAFYDAGSVTRRSTLRSGSDSSFIHGAGLGAAYSLPEAFRANLSVSRRIGDNPDANPLDGTDSDGSLKDWRIWAGLSKSF
jgi:hemolysin activation/secretion protein